jgi:hypothetical protein
MNLFVVIGTAGGILFLLIFTALAWLYWTEQKDRRF